MPKYDAKTLNRVITAVQAMRICCSVTQEHMKNLDLWDDNMQQFHDGMVDAYTNVIDLLIEMKNTAKAKNEKA